MIQYDPGSFKDPGGRVFRHAGNVYRTVSTQGVQAFTLARDGGLLRSLETENLLVPAELVRTADVGLSESEVGVWLLKTAYRSIHLYSYEWSFEMLRDAALTTLQIIDRALQADFILKDANAFNILFMANRPRLTDVPSLEPYRDGEVWAGYSQFCRSFLFPLLLGAYRGADFRALLRGMLGEIPVEEIARLLRMRDYVRPGILTDVLVQARLERGFGRSGRDVKVATTSVRYPKQALTSNIRRLIKLVEGLRMSRPPTEWTDYESFHSYSDSDRAAKASFVSGMLDGGNFRRVVDLGCNTGTYARLALDAGCEVVALDVDALAIDRLYRQAPGGAAVWPIVASLLNPTPAMGWGLQERQALLDRLGADGFLALALIHHLRITGGVPLELIVRQLFAIAPEGIVEWVDKEDAMVQQMLALRPDVYADYTWPNFLSLLEQQGQVVAAQESHAGHRRLCHVRSRNNRAAPGLP